MKNVHVVISVASLVALTVASFWVYGKDDFAQTNINKKTFPCFKYESINEDTQLCPIRVVTEPTILFFSNSRTKKEV